jgi:ATP-binding cassette subfamily A (ABC1) protein 3
MFLMMCNFVDSARKSGTLNLLFAIVPLVLFAVPNFTASSSIIAAIFFPSFALTAAFSTFTSLETGFNGIQSGISFQNIVTTGPYEVSIAQLLIILICQCPMFTLLHFYFEKVLPSATASPLSPLFFLSRDYWKPTPSITIENEPMRASETYEAMEGAPCVRIRGLTKSFKKIGAAGIFENPSWFRAVDGLNLDMYEGEIFCLLGHNGAGKSTTISMLTSLMSVDEGDAVLFGNSVRSQPEQVVRDMGVCLQQNILLDDLTVEEHMRLFAAIRRVPSNDVETSITELLSSVDLLSQRSQMAKTLSGGQKRRLCTCMAFLGNPKIVFLDEPTTGLDPSARRSLWNFLKERRAGRVIVLTTHFMDEADFLADRKGIIVDGRLAVCGSSPFLKNKFGLGYNLTLSVKPSFNNMGPLLNLVRSIVPEASSLESGGDPVIALPMASLPHIPTLLDLLDMQGKDMGVNSYGLNTTTLEQVTLAVLTCNQIVILS